MAAAAVAKKVVEIASLASWAGAAVGSESGALGSRVFLWKGDLATLKAGAVVNAANSMLRRGGGVCGALHAAAVRESCLVRRKPRSADSLRSQGPELERECLTIGGCPTGKAVMTKG